MAEDEIKDEPIDPPAPNPAITEPSGTPPQEAARPAAARDEPAPAAGDPPADQHPDLPDFSAGVLGSAGQSIDLIGDVELNVKVELGRCRMAVEDVLRLGEGSVVELNKLAGDPVDVLVNDRLVARGEVLVLNDTFCVRVNEIVAEEPATK